jgi:hypothetical protein
VYLTPPSPSHLSYFLLAHPPNTPACLVSQHNGADDHAPKHIAAPPISSRAFLLHQGAIEGVDLTLETAQTP